MKSINAALKYFLVFVISIWIIHAYAQKLPNKQEESVRAPIDVKVDGKAIEWNKFQAYNHATDIFYTMANDDENLIFVLQAKDQSVINKIFGGGVTLTIQRSADKKEKNKMSVTYPVIDSKTALIFQIMPNSLDIPDTTVKTADSIMALHNKLLRQKCKWIAVSGIKGVDTLISVYNKETIKAAGLFDNKKVYTIEMSISLNDLELSAANAEKFSYNVRVNAAKQTSELYGYAPAKLVQLHAEFNARQSSPTDFWGEYTLAKK